MNKNSLRNIRQANNQFAWMISKLLNENSCVVDKEVMAEVNADGSLPAELLYRDILVGLFGLTPKEDDVHRRFVDCYFARAVNRLDANDYEQNPYFKNIVIANESVGEWRFQYDYYKPYEAFVCNDILLDSEMHEVPQVGFFETEFKYPVVYQGDREWMAIKPNEIETMKEPLDAVRGKVVTFGLGIGYFAYMASQKESVDSITIVEKDENVIRLFEKYILPQFENRQKVDVVNADAFDFVREQMPAMDYDYAFVDLWHDVQDGLPLYIVMRHHERKIRQTKFLYWVEASLMSGLRWQVFDAVVEREGEVESIVKILTDRELLFDEFNPKRSLDRQG